MGSKEFNDFLDGMAKATDALNKIISPEEDPGKPVRLTADKLHELRWMTERQIDAIYHHGKTPFVIDDDPKAYYELRWMTEGQLEALFGKAEE